MKVEALLNGLLFIKCLTDLDSFVSRLYFCSKIYQYAILDQQPGWPFDAIFEVNSAFGVSQPILWSLFYT